MEQIKNDQIVTATDSCSSSMSPTINEKTLTKFEGSDDINDLSIQIERSAKRTELIQ
ncbi:21887_t:CDS:2, partial [Rhizophagus irregularis]